MSSLQEFQRETDAVYSRLASSMKESEKLSQSAKQIAISVTAKTKNEQRKAITKGFQLLEDGISGARRVELAYPEVIALVKKQLGSFSPISQKSLTRMLEDFRSAISELLRLAKQFELLSKDERLQNVKRLFFDEISRRKTDVVMAEFDKYRKEIIQNSQSILVVSYEILDIIKSMKTVTTQLLQGTLKEFDIEKVEDEMDLEEVKRRLADESEQLLSLEEVKKSLGL